MAGCASRVRMVAHLLVCHRMNTGAAGRKLPLCSVLYSQASGASAQELMTDPVVAADNYTYQRSAIQQWLERSSMSPTTQLPLAHKGLAPNAALQAEIYGELLR